MNRIFITLFFFLVLASGVAPYATAAPYPALFQSDSVHALLGIPAEPMDDQRISKAAVPPAFLSSIAFSADSLQQCQAGVPSQTRTALLKRGRILRI